MTGISCRSSDRKKPKKYHKKPKKTEKYRKNRKKPKKAEKYRKKPKKTERYRKFQIWDWFFSVFFGFFRFFLGCNPPNNLFDKSGGKEDVERTAIEFSEISLEPKDTLAVDSNKVKTDDLGKLFRVRISY